MQISKYIIVLVCALFVIICVGSCTLSKKCVDVESIYAKSCDSTFSGFKTLITRDNAKFWQLDSIGKNGYRRIIAPLIINNCNLVGKKWSTIVTFFGEENSHEEILSGATLSVTKRYIIFKKQGVPGYDYCNEYLRIDISKSDSTILWLKIFHPDG